MPGLREARPWTSREATSAQEAPKRLVVLGGGPVGCELAQAWADLGSQVTLLQRGDRLLPTLEPFAGEYVAKGLRELGVDVRTGCQVQSATRDDDGPTTLTTSAGDFSADAVLVATGRTPNTTDIGLETVGLKPDERPRGRRQLPGHRGRRRLAVRGRGRQRSRALHPHGQVPGPHLR